MNAREVLHDLVDKLPESELVTAARILKALEEPANRLEALLAIAPEDDEPFDARALDDTEAPFVAHGDVIRDRQEDWRPPLLWSRRVPSTVLTPSA